MNIRVLLALAAIVVLFAGVASATPVALINPLMQDPTPTTCWDPANNPGPWDSVTDGQSTTYPSGWQAVNSTVPSIIAGDVIEEYNPTSADFSGAAGNGTLPAPAGVVKISYSGVVTNTLYGASKPAMGSQALFNASDVDNDIAVLDDAQGNNGPAQPSITLQKNTTYTFTVSIGQGLTNTLGYFAGFSLMAVDPTLSSAFYSQEYHNTAQDNPDPGTFYDYSITFDGNDIITGKKGAPKAGDTIRFGATIGTGTYMTNARLDITPDVPEPSTLVLLASGLVGLLAYAWRKRK